MNSFTLSLLTAASMSSMALAQIPRECFFVTEMHGPENTHASLLSNLPMLQAMYQPGQRLESIVAMQDPQEGDRLTGLQANLSEGKSNYLELNTIGTRLEQWDSQKVSLAEEKPSRIKIIEDEEGICDVILFQGGNRATSLSVVTKDCQPALQGIKETTLQLPDETPLVGFHGMASDNVLTQLGLIMVNTEDQMCRHTMLHGDQMRLYQNMDIQEASAYAENSITSIEKERASALEAIIVYDSMVKNRKSEQEIQDAIHALETKRPIQVVGNKPQSQEELKELLTRLSSYDKMNRSVAKSELKDLFWRLSDYYEEEASIEHSLQIIPIQIKYLKQVYDHFPVERQGTNPFKGVNYEENATVLDLDSMLDELAEHYAELDYGPVDDMSNQDRDMLIFIFDHMHQFYLHGEGVQFDGAFELAQIFLDLKNTLGSISQDYHKSEEEIHEIYGKITNDETINQTIDGATIEDFEDLLELEERERDHQIDLLMTELQKVESYEHSTMNYFNEQYNLIDTQVDQLENILKGEDGRFKNLEKSIINGQQMEQKQEDELLEAIYLSEKSMPETFSEVVNNMPQVREEAMMTPSSVSSDESLSDTQVQQIKDLLSQDNTKDYTMYFTALVALVVGIMIGGACLMCIMNSCKRNQEKRLIAARQMFDNTTVDHTADNHVGQMQATSAVKNMDTIDEEKASPPRAVERDEQPVGHVYPRGRRGTQLKQMDTEDLEAEKEEGDDIMDNFENNMEQMLSSRGLNFDKPMERRSTHQIKAPPSSLGMQKQFGSAEKRNQLNF